MQLRAVLFLALAASLGSGDPVKRQMDERPNFIIMLMDDVSQHLISLHALLFEFVYIPSFVLCSF